MSELSFEWDPAKATANLRKHRVTFDEASTVFEDEHALLIADPDPSDYEERFVLLGASRQSRLLVVCHCIRQSETYVRIISARKATPRERGVYRARLV
ncbi:MAG: BrnT family toxin [Lacipirellulaceae bacterium]